jgi:hypothetical protein
MGAGMIQPQALRQATIQPAAPAVWTWPLAELLTVHDGDTVRVRIDQGFDELTRQWIRLETVRAPDPGTPDYTPEDYERA